MWSGIGVSRRRVRNVLTGAVWMGLGAGTALSPRVEAQEFQVGPGLVIEMKTIATAPGLSEGMQQSLAPALNLLGYLVGPNEDLQEAYDALGPPETVTQDVTVYIKGARMRVDIGGNSLLGKLAPDGTVAEWAVLDPASGRIVESDFFNAAMQGASDPYEAFGGEVERPTRVVTRTSETREIQGHTAQKYVIQDWVVLNTGLEGEEGELGVSLNSVTDTWVATNGPYTEDAGIVQFFRVFGQGLGLNPQNPGQSAQGDDLPPAAIILASHEEAAVSVGSVSAGTGSQIATATSSTEIRSISRRPLDDALFSGFDRSEQACDCSCAAFKELQAIGKLPKDQQQAHPKAMALSMCAPKCGMKWAMQCGGGQLERR